MDSCAVQDNGAGGLTLGGIGRLRVSGLFPLGHHILDNSLSLDIGD